MTEDAIKAGRNAHRLIIGVSATVLVFALSLDLASLERDQKEKIDRFIELDLRSYDRWLESRLQREYEDQLAPIGQALDQTLSQLDLGIENTDSLVDTMSRPVYVIRPEIDALLKSPDSLTLKELQRANELPINEDIVILKPQQGSIEGRVVDFLRQHDRKDLRVVNSYTSLESPDISSGETLETDSLIGSLYFEIVSIETLESAPVFHELFPLTRVAVPESSFSSWISQLDSPEIVKYDSGKLVFLPSVAHSDSNVPLREISSELANRIEAAAPSNRTVTILTLQFPGSVVVLAAPIILTVLAYNFRRHADNIVSLAHRVPLELAGSGWLLMSESPRWRKRTTPILLPFFMEHFLTTVVLPCLSLIVLGTRLTSFGEIGLATGIVFILSIALIIVLARASFADIHKARSEIFARLRENDNSGATYKTAKIVRRSVNSAPD